MEYKLANLISVVIPFYSRERGILARSVESALAQKSVDVEVIVVDDASPISAADELSNIRDERLKIIRHQFNTNGGIARNTGIKNSNGFFIAFLDFDDIWYVNKLKKQFDYYRQLLSQHEKPVIYSQANIIDGKREFIRPIRGIREKESVGDYLFLSLIHI